MSERDTDAELVARVQRGDKRAFDLLVLKYQRKIMRLLSRMVRDPSEVEDVAQETFNTARNWQASAARRPNTLQNVETEEGETFDRIDNLSDISTPESMMVSRQIAETVNTAIQALPEELRTAIVLREIEGMSYEDIAQTMDCPIGTVRSRIFRARDAIAAQLRPILDGEDSERRW